MPQQQPPRPPIEMMKPFASDTLLAIGGLLGLVLMLIGSWIVGLVGGGQNAGWLLKSIGVFVLSIVLLFGAFVRSDIDKHVRLGMILTAAFLIGYVGFWG